MYLLLVGRRTLGLRRHHLYLADLMWLLEQRGLL